RRGGLAPARKCKRGNNLRGVRSESATPPPTGGSLTGTPASGQAWRQWPGGVGREAFRQPGQRPAQARPPGQRGGRGLTCQTGLPCREDRRCRRRRMRGASAGGDGTGSEGKSPSVNEVLQVAALPVPANTPVDVTP